MSSKYIILIPILFIAFILFSLYNFIDDNSNDKQKLLDEFIKNTYNYNFEFITLKDTVYVIGDSYIELSLKDQRAKFISRKDSGFTFKVSTGNMRIKEGIETPPGIYTVQSKSRLAISKQFNNAKLINWVGFRGNIGFHGLEGRGYYNHLGNRPSSHGCVRISVEDGNKLYKYVKIGTPIIVFNEEPARVLAFNYQDSLDFENSLFLKSKNQYYKAIMNNRLTDYYKGNAYKNQYKIYIDSNTVLRPGSYSIGNAKYLPSRQKNYYNIINKFNTVNDNLVIYNNYFFKSSPSKDTAKTEEKIN